VIARLRGISWRKRLSQADILVREAVAARLAGLLELFLLS
jgi:hypothetical protein